jgi:hypothetical protein
VTKPLGMWVGAIACIAVSFGVLAEEPKPAPTPKVDLKPSVSGYFQVDYRLGDNKGVVTNPEQEFSLRRARLIVAGAVTSRVSYTVAFQGDGAAVSSASIIDLYVDFGIREWLKVRAGQYKYEFDFEGRESDAAIPLADRSFATNAVAGSLNGASTASTPASVNRDRGVTLMGSWKWGRSKWGYGLGAFQGSGRASDNNNDVAVTANLNVQPVEGLTLNGGFLSSDTQDQGAPVTTSFRGWVLGAAYDKGKAFARAEYYGGQRKLPTGDADLSGYYAVLGWTPHKSLDLLARYQAYEDGQFASGNDQVRSVDVSARWFLSRKGRRSGTFLSLTYMFREADAGFKKGLTLLNDGRGAALSDGNLVAPVLIARAQVVF